MNLGHRLDYVFFRGDEYCENLKILKAGKKRQVHSILTYQTASGRLGCIGRDLNAVRNMKKLVESFLEENEGRKDLIIFKGVKK